MNVPHIRKESKDIVSLVAAQFMWKLDMVDTVASGFAIPPRMPTLPTNQDSLTGYYPSHLFELLVICYIVNKLTLNVLIYGNFFRVYIFKFFGCG